MTKSDSEEGERGLEYDGFVVCAGDSSTDMLEEIFKGANVVVEGDSGEEFSTVPLRYGDFFLIPDILLLVFALAPLIR